MATAGTTPSAPGAAAAAAERSSGPFKVVMPDQTGSYQLPVARGMVQKVQVVDVDMVLQMTDGSRVVLAGGAISAMDDEARVSFSDSVQSAGKLLDQVGKIALQKHDPQILSSEAPRADSPAAAQEDNHFTGNNHSSAQISTATMSQLSQIIKDNAVSVTENRFSNTKLTETKADYQTQASSEALVKHIPESLPERPGAIPVVPVVGPQAPTVAVKLVNLATQTQVGSTLYGSGGTPASATDGANNTQFASQVINAGNDVTTIYAAGNNNNTFTKVFNVTISGDGNVKSLIISGVPADMSILNATALGGGQYLATLTSADQKTFNLQLVYNTQIASASNVPDVFKLSFATSITTVDGTSTLTETRYVAIKDAANANDLVYVDPATGNNVLILPGQGIPHIVHAGNGGVTIYGSNANDALYGGSGNDTIIGGAGSSSYFEGGAGADVLTGSATGNNTAGYTGSAAGVTINLAAGTASGGDAQGDTLTNIQNLIGSAHDDTFVANAAANRLDGGSGGSDTVSYAASDAAVTVNLNTGTGSGGYAQGDTYVHIQNAIGSAYNDTFIASGEANRFDGGSGGVDTVSYAASTSGVTVNLKLNTGSGGFAQGDTYVHIQNVIGSAFDDIFIANGDANRFDGGSGGVDTVSYAGSASGVLVNFSTGRGTGGDAEGDSYVNIQKVIGSGFDDTFIAGVDSKSFDGGSGGSDTVSYVASGSAVTVNMVTMSGSGGYAQGNTYANIRNIIGSNYDDLFIGGPQANHFDGGQGGFDTVSYALSDQAVTVDLYNGTASGGYAAGDTLAHIWNVIGSAYNDTFIASNDHNQFDGGLGVNTVSYQYSGGGVVIDLSNAIGTGTGGNFADGDRFVNIQNLLGSLYDDTFVASSDANVLDGNTGSLHNRVSYAASNQGVTVDLNYTNGTGTFGGYAQGDKLINIQDLTGSAFDDTFVANGAANNFDGGTSTATSHNRVSYAADTTGVTVDLTQINGSGTFGGYAQGDTLTNIQDLTGGSGNDTFIASAAANNFDGGVSTAASHNRVSYAASNAGVTVDLNYTNGTGTSGGFADGDTLVNIQDLTGSSSDDTFIASAAANNFDGGISGVTSHNRVSYAASNAGVTVDLNYTNGTGTFGGYADGDTLVNIQDLTGSSADDTFVASAAANNFDGGVSTAASHNRVSYAASTVGVTVDLNYTNGTGTSGGYATGDTLVNIQDLTGGSGDDTFIANAAANNFDGGVSTAASHNRVSYAASNAGVTVDLNYTNGTGTSGGYAGGDTLTNIQDLTGSSSDDTFIASAAANNFDGGVSTATSHNRVSYAASNAGVTVDLNYTNGTGTSGGYAAGDTLTNIQDLTGSSSDDTFIASAASNNFDGGVSTATSHNRVSYAASNAGVTVDLNYTNGTGTSGGYAAGDTLVNIQDLTGSSSDDTFVASAASNNFDGGVSTATSHNRVSYAASNAGVTVDLNYTNGTGTSGGYAQGDTLTNIQDLTGSSSDDTFIANAAANNFDGGVSTATSHNRVSYAASNSGVTVDLNYTNGTGTSGGYAQGDTLTNIQDLTGSSSDDTFIANAAANNFDGGVSTATSHNRVSYAASNAGVTVDLNYTNGTGTSGGYAAGDTLINIQDLTGSSSDDTFIANAAANNFDGGVSSATSHNRVSYAASNAGVTVDLNYTNGTGTSGGYAAGDTLVNIQDLTGSSSDDTFVASAASNNFDGGVSTATSHNRVSYAASNAGVTVDLNYTNGTGTSGGYAQGDTLTNIQDLTGSSSDDTFIASLASNNFDGGVSTATSHNRVSYAASNSGVTVDLNYTNGTGTSGGYAQGDTLTNIQDLTGSSSDDTFVASAASNNFDGGVSTATSHNRVSYAASNAGVMVDLNYTNGTGTSGGYAQGDTLTNIQDLTGSSSDDTFVASAASNNFDGGVSTATSHNRVSYAASNAGVTVDLNYTNGTGTSGGYAQGDTLTNIQDLTGSSSDDIFIASLASNNFDGGVSTATSHNRVSYAASNTGVTVDLNYTNGTGTSGGYAQGDTLTNIQDLTGSSSDDTFVASAASNNFDGGVSTATSHNRVSYAASNAGVTVDLNYTNGTGTSGGYAQGDTLTNIQDLTGSSSDDTFIASAAANRFDGGVSSATSHNRVSYAASNAGVTVDLNYTNGTGTSGGYAQGDTLTNIQDLTGSSSDDIFIASLASNNFDGGVSTATSHNRVSYAASNAGVTVDLNYTNGTGTSGGYAQGDTLTNIQDLTGSSSDDTFVASAAANNFDGGVSTATSHNRVSYAASNAGVTVDLNYTNGTGTFGGYAQGDTLTNIQDLTGSSSDDTFIASAAANKFDGGVSTATSHNRVSYAASNAGVTVDLSQTNGGGTSGGYAAGDTLINIQDLTGSGFNDTFIANAAANNLDGGAGSDTVSYATANNGVGVTVNLSTGLGSGATGSWAIGDSYANIENIIGTQYADILTGANSGVSVLNGGVGGDTLIAVAANRANTFASYADITGFTATTGVTVDLSGGTGSGGWAQGDILINIDNVIGSTKDDTFIANANANILDGGAGNDTVSYAAANNGVGVTVNLSTGLGSGAAGSWAIGDTYVNIENIIGSQYADILTGASGGNSVLRGGGGADVMTGIGTGNYISYAGSAAAVSIDFKNGTGSGGDAQGDTFFNIWNVIGSSNDDTFYASTQANVFNGGGGNDTVSYMYDTAGVVVDLANITAASGLYALGDTFINIRNVTGGSGNDMFYATTDANAFIGGGGSDTVNYSHSTTGVVVDLYHGNNNLFAGNGAFAAGDSYSGIQNVVGSTANDTFYANAAANAFTGGGGSDTVSYKYANSDGLSTATVIANLATHAGTGGDAAGDTYSGIANLTGSAYVNSNLTGDGGANILTALGSNTVNRLDGGGAASGMDYLYATDGGMNTLIAGSGATTFMVSAHNSSTIVNYSTGNANLALATGAGAAGTTILHFDDLGAQLNVSSFSNLVHGITTLDVSSGTNTNVLISAADVQHMGVNNVLTVKLSSNESFQIPTTDYYRTFFNGDYVFYDSTYTNQIAIIHTTLT